MEMPGTDKDFLTVAQAARVCKVTRVTMWRWVKSGGIRSSLTAGGHHRIADADLAQFIKTKNMGARLQNDSGRQRILIVEDEAPVQRYLTRMLAKHGYHVQVCSDGFEAGIQVMKFRPHLILMDLFMPRMDGFQTCSIIRKEPETSNIKILAMSGNCSETTVDRILKCGADRFMPKPIDSPTVLKEIETMLAG
jgi:excisionase family DNA binding protein